MIDSLGDRMKQQYEDRTRYQIPRRTYTILRIDGKAFHTYTRNCQKPYDHQLHVALVEAAKALCEEAQGCAMAYIQSDEASFLLTDFARNETQAWFDGLLQKVTSVACSVFTSEFWWNRHLQGESRRASFDCRVFTIPDPTEVENYFIWRNKDAIRNSVSSLAQSVFSAKQLHGKQRSEMLTMLVASAGIQWEQQPEWAKFGTIVEQQPYESEPFGGEELSVVIRYKWESRDAWNFIENRQWLKSVIPRYESETITG